MQTMILPDFSDIVRKKAKKIPGKLGACAKAMNVCRRTLDTRLDENNFSMEELRALDSILNFTEAEKSLIWR